jgi:hypothetical protein
MGIESLQPCAQFTAGIIGEFCLAQCNSRIGSQWTQFDSMDLAFAAFAQFLEQFIKRFISRTSRVLFRDLWRW